MAMPIPTAVVSVPLAHHVGAERLAAIVPHTHVVFNNMADQRQPTARSLMDVMGILPPARQMAGVARGLNGAPWRSDLQIAAS